MKWMKVALPIGVLLVGYIGMKGIEASASDNTIKEEVEREHLLGRVLQ